MNCTWWWELTNDGVIAKEVQGHHSTNQMTPADLAAADAILSSSSFEMSMVGGFTCDPAPGGVIISFVLKHSDVELEVPVTGCVMSGPTFNIAQELYALVTKD